MGCGGAPQPKPDQPLVTRKSEPFLPRVQRPAATRFSPTEMELVRLEEMLAVEAESNELVSAVGLQYAERRMVVVAHVRYPPLEMEERAYEAAVNEEILTRCDEQFANCVEGEPGCDDAAYEGCIRTAYTDPFVYYASHLGMDCGVLELSRYDSLETGLRLQERRTIEEIVCDFDHLGNVPAATDLDGDGGPELVYTYSYSSIDRDREWITDALTIVDAEDLHIQARLTVQEPLDTEYEASITSVDTGSDGARDLVVDQVTMEQYCPPSGWALSSRFVLPEEPPSDGETCVMTVRRRVIPYDPEQDVWTVPEGAP